MARLPGLAFSGLGSRSAVGRLGKTFIIIIGKNIKCTLTHVIIIIVISIGVFLFFFTFGIALEEEKEEDTPRPQEVFWIFGFGFEAMIPPPDLA